eukprot:gene37891-49658_t
MVTPLDQIDIHDDNARSSILVSDLHDSNLAIDSVSTDTYSIVLSDNDPGFDDDNRRAYNNKAVVSHQENMLIRDGQSSIIASGHEQKCDREDNVSSSLGSILVSEFHDSDSASIDTYSIVLSENNPCVDSDGLSEVSSLESVQVSEFRDSDSASNDTYSIALSEYTDSLMLSSENGENSDRSDDNVRRSPIHNDSSSIAAERMLSVFAAIDSRAIIPEKS